MDNPIQPNGVAPAPEPENPEGNSNPVEGASGSVSGKCDISVDSNNVSGSNSRKNNNGGSSSNGGNVFVKRERPTRACTAKPPKYVDPPVIERRAKVVKKEKVVKVVVVEEGEGSEGEGFGGEEGGSEGKEQCSKVVTPLVNEPTLEQMPRWELRSMWELASVLNFFHVFGPLLNFPVEFSAEELESALLAPNDTLGDIHIPLLKAIPPVIRMACGHDTWVTVLCRKLRDWWHWVAEGDLPIVASQGSEIEAYRTLEPGVRVKILKALCDIRVEQEDIRSYMENSLKQGIQLSAFRKDRIGGDSHGISYWYEDDEAIGHRLYREIRKVEVKKGKTRGSNVFPSTTYEWETVATNLDEFIDVGEKLFSSKNRTEASLGKKLRNDMLPEIETIHKRKEKLLKKQQRQALLLDNFSVDGLAAGRSLRGRKPVSYTFDDFDRSINEAIKMTKRKQPSPEHASGREGSRSAPSANGGWHDSSHSSLHVTFRPPSLINNGEADDDYNSGVPDRSNRRRLRPQRYAQKEFVGSGLEKDGAYDSDDDIVGEAVYDEEYLRQRKQRKKLTSSSEGEGDEEYHWSEENGEDDVEEGEEEDEDSSSMSEDSDQPRARHERLDGRTRRETKLRSVDDIKSGLRRSNRATRNRIDYRQYEFSESENESTRPRRGVTSERHSDGTENVDDSMDSQEFDDNEEGLEREFDQPTAVSIEKDENPTQDKSENLALDDLNGVGERQFLDLNELAPGPGFEDGPSALVKDDDLKGE